MSISSIPKDYKVRLTLCNEKGDMIGEAMMGMDFIAARKEFYDESGLDFNLEEVWKQYFAGLEPKHQQALLEANGDQDKKEDEV